MSGARERDRAAAGPVSSDRTGITAAPVVPITARDSDDRWVSPVAVRQAIGSWAYALGSASRRPTDAEVRTAIGVAHAICERSVDDGHRRFAQRGTGEEGAGEAQRDRFVPEDAADLADRAGIGRGELEAALAVLVSARAIVRHNGATTPTVAVAGELLTPLPAVRRVDWMGARGRLRVIGASIPPALAVLRELGVTVGALAVGESPPPVRASVRDLEEATGFGRSTVSDALTALERARLVTAEVRAGRTTRFTLRPVLYGMPDHAAETESVAETGGRSFDVPPRTGASADRRHDAVERMRSGAGTGRQGRGLEGDVRPFDIIPATSPAPAAQHGAASTLLATFGGTPVHAPVGTPVVLEQDEHGRWICRIGPLTLGPIDG